MGEGGRLPSNRARVVPVLNAPLPNTDVARRVQALHVEARGARLWAVLREGDVLAWDLLELRSLGRWKVRRPLDAGGIVFQPQALCEDSQHGVLYILGQRPTILARVHTMLDDLRTSAKQMDSITDSITDDGDDSAVLAISPPGALTDSL